MGWFHRLLNRNDEGGRRAVLREHLEHEIASLEQLIAREPQAGGQSHLDQSTSSLRLMIMREDLQGKRFALSQLQPLAAAPSPTVP